MEAYWCFANPILEQVQSFTITYIRNIERCHEVVGSFKNLERLGFATSETFEDPFDGDNDVFSEIDDDTDGEFDNETESGWDRKASKQRRNEATQDQMQVVREHVLLFKGRLESFDSLKGNVWHKVDSEITDRFRVDFYRLLLPLSKPTYLGSEVVDYQSHETSRFPSDARL